LLLHLLLRDFEVGVQPHLLIDDSLDISFGHSVLYAQHLNVLLAQFLLRLQVSLQLNLNKPTYSSDAAAISRR
jgi:hypothetical protein